MSRSTRADLKRHSPERKKNYRQPHMMHKDAFEHYERWRRQWLDGGDSNAIQILHFHGLHDALLLTSSKCPDPCHASDENEQSF